MARGHAQRARIALPPSPVLLTKYLAKHTDRAESAQPSSHRRVSSVDERETNEVRDLLRVRAEEVSKMPEAKTVQRAKKARRQGKASTTAAGEFVREEIEHVRQGKHGARSPKQAIAIGLSKAS